jgi:DNA anti-recombination protein RmuC
MSKESKKAKKSKEMKKYAEKILTELDNILEEQGAQYQIEVKKISYKSEDGIEEEVKEQDLSWTA